MDIRDFEIEVRLERIDSLVPSLLVSTRRIYFLIYKGHDLLNLSQISGKNFYAVENNVIERIIRHIMDRKCCIKILKKIATIDGEYDEY